MEKKYNGTDRRLAYLFYEATHVEVDPIQTAGIPVADITIDGETTRLYSLPGGSGADVEANPVGTPTADLDTIRIGQTIYDIPGSGGGDGQNFSCKLIFKNDPLPTKQNASNGVTRNYTLGESIDNYDALYLVAMTDYSATGVPAGCSSAMIFKDEYHRGTNNCISGSYTDGRLCYVAFTDSTHVTTISWANTGYYDPILYAIYGIKFASNVISNHYLSDYYSTDERVVGRWTDGKPVYETTFDLGSDVTFGSGWADTPISNDGIDKIVNTLSFVTSAGINRGIPQVQANYGNYIRVCWLGGSDAARYLTIQYTKTTDAAGTGPTPGNLIYLPALYSEEEREVGVWTDGKPLYQKCADITVQSGNLNAWIDHHISGLTDAEIVHYDYDILFLDPSNGKNAVYDNAYRFEVARLSTTQLYIIAGSGWNTGNIKIRLIIQYTKTTDQPGSGTWTPDGQLAHHYSNTEKVVGTWVDGSTLYEITLPNVAITSVSSIMDIYTNLNLAINKLVSMVIRVWKSDGDAEGDMTVIEGSYKEMTFYYRKSIDSIRMEQPYSWMAGRFINATIQYTKT